MDEELKSTIEEEMLKMKVITPTSISGKYNIRVSLAKEIISDLEHKGKIKLVDQNPRIKVYTPIEKAKKKDN